MAQDDWCGGDKSTVGGSLSILSNVVKSLHEYLFLFIGSQRPSHRLTNGRCVRRAVGPSDTYVRTYVREPNAPSVGSRECARPPVGACGRFAGIGLINGPQRDRYMDGGPTHA